MVSKIYTAQAFACSALYLSEITWVQNIIFEGHS